MQIHQGYKLCLKSYIFELGEKVKKSPSEVTVAIMLLKTKVIYTSSLNLLLTCLSPKASKNGCWQIVRNTSCPQGLCLTVS